MIRGITIPEAYIESAPLTFTSEEAARNLVVVSYKPNPHPPQVETNIFAIYLHLASEYNLGILGTEGRFSLKYDIGLTRGNLRNPRTIIKKMETKRQLRHPQLVGSFAVKTERPLFMKGFENPTTDAQTISKLRADVEKFRRDGSVNRRAYSTIIAALVNITDIRHVNQSTTEWQNAVLRGTLKMMADMDEDIAMVTTGVNFVPETIGQLKEVDEQTNYYLVNPRGYTQ